MDPITTAITAALASGLTQPLVSEIYTRLMKYIRSKYGESNLPATVEMLKNTPDSDVLPVLLQEEVKRAKADKDIELSQLAEEILDILGRTPEGQKVINIVNSKVGIVGDNATVHGGIKL